MSDLDDILDDGFPYPHLDPPELNDLQDQPTIDFDGARYWIGDNKAVVEKHVEPRDPWSYERRKVADRFGIPESELLDEPDNHPGSEEQAWA